MRMFAVRVAGKSHQQSANNTIARSLELFHKRIGIVPSIQSVKSLDKIMRRINEARENAQELASGFVAEGSPSFDSTADMSGNPSGNGRGRMISDTKNEFANVPFGQPRNELCRDIVWYTRLPLLIISFLFTLFALLYALVQNTAELPYVFPGTGKLLHFSLILFSSFLDIATQVILSAWFRHAQGWTKWILRLQTDCWLFQFIPGFRALIKIFQAIQSPGVDWTPRRVKSRQKFV